MYLEILMSLMNILKTIINKDILYSDRVRILLFVTRSALFLIRLSGWRGVFGHVCEWRPSGRVDGFHENDFKRKQKKKKKHRILICMNIVSIFTVHSAQSINEIKKIIIV